MEPIANRIDKYYGRENVADRILTAIHNAGKDIERLSYEDICTIDQLHIGGLEKTRDLFRLADLPVHAKVLDVGSGLGGPARTLAAECGCDVTGIDATDEFCRTANMLTQEVGLGDTVRFHHGSALNMPFDDASFNAAVMLHASMNIEDKSTLYAEIARVLRPGSRLAMYEILAGAGGGDLHFPVPWSPDASLSFLLNPDEMIAHLSAAGFARRAWNDVTADAAAWVERLLQEAGTDQQSSPPSPGRIMGPEFPIKAENLARNLAEKRLAIVQAVFERGTAG